MVSLTVMPPLNASVAPAVIVVPGLRLVVPRALLWATSKVPEVTVVRPLYVLFPLSICVPEFVFARLMRVAVPNNKLPEKLCVSPVALLRESVAVATKPSLVIVPLPAMNLAFWLRPFISTIPGAFTVIPEVVVKTPAASISKRPSLMVILLWLILLAR